MTSDSDLNLSSIDDGRCASRPHRFPCVVADDRVSASEQTIRMHLKKFGCTQISDKGLAHIKIDTRGCEAMINQNRRVIRVAGEMSAKFLGAQS
tara:strand:+ start:4403 stop:4684 length:282 start_codon:yes stop_codon:yes gene_type:complete